MKKQYQKDPRIEFINGLLFMILCVTIIAAMMLFTTT